MTDSKVFEPSGTVILRDGSNASGSQLCGGNGRSSWTQTMINAFRRAVHRIERMSLEHGRLPRGWERGL